MIRLKKLLFEQTLGTAILRYGSRGDNVTALQKMLINKGYLSAKLPSGKPADDGKFGPATKTAVINFQKAMIEKGVLPAKQKSGRTSADGIVGDDTKAALANDTSSNKEKDINFSFDLPNFDSSDNDLNKLTYDEWRNKSDQEIYDILRGPNVTADIIANVIRASKGGTWGNDKEAWVEAAVAAIKDISMYKNVSNKLGTDVRKFVSEYMDIDASYLTDQGATIASMLDNFNAPGFGILLSWPTYQPSLPADLVQSYPEAMDVYNKIMSSIFSGWKKNSIGEQGHGGVAIVSADGNVYMAEFGRYSNPSIPDGKKWWLTTSDGKAFAEEFKNQYNRDVTLSDIPNSVVAGYGKVISKNLGRIAKISEDGTYITNIDDIIPIIKRNSQGDGPNLPMDYVVLKNLNYNAALNFIQSSPSREYSFFDFGTGGGSNCATFAADTLIAGGIGSEGVCWPTIYSQLNYYKTHENKIDQSDSIPPEAIKI